jgi:hypothetical protein
VNLVEIRCKARNCGRKLDVVEAGAAPVTEEAWASYVRVQICQRHGPGAGRGNIRRWQERQRRAGKPADRVETGRYIQWAELRPKVEEAWRTRQTQVHVI